MDGFAVCTSSEAGKSMAFARWFTRSLSVVVWSREVVLGVVRIHIGQAGQGQTTKALESQAAPHATGIREPVPVPEEQSNLMSTFA